MSGAASSSIMLGFQGLPQNPLNQRPTSSLLSSFDMTLLLSCAPPKDLRTPRRSDDPISENTNLHRPRFPSSQDQGRRTRHSSRACGGHMDVRAAVALAAGKPLEIATVKLDGPKAGEVLVEIKATGVCHTDEFTLSGADPEGLFPAILGHEGAGVVVDVGPGVTSVKKGDHVIPLYTPECRQCPSCLSRKTNLCTAIRTTQGQGVMPDGTSRFSRGGKKIAHYMGCSTFAQHTVLPEIALAKIRPDA